MAKWTEAAILRECVVCREFRQIEKFFAREHVCRDCQAAMESVTRTQKGS